MDLVHTLRVAFAVAAKELRTGVRDRQAMVYSVLLPLALYPVLFWVMLQGALVMQGQRERTEVKLGVVGVRDAHEDEALADALVEGGEDQAPGPVALRDDAPPSRATLRAGEVDALLTLGLDGTELGDLLPWLPDEPGGDAGEGAGEPRPTRLWYDGSRSRSSLAKRRAEERLRDLARDERVAAVGGDPARLEAFRVEEVSLATEVEDSAFLLSFLLPMMFCIMTVLGAFFPAVDLSAGEKERHTAETTLLLPVSRVGVIVGKVLTVTVFALIATTLNISGLLIAAQHLLAGLDTGFEFEVPWSAFPKAAPLLLLFLLSTSAILFAIASFADTFKQGQSLLGPVQMFIMVPAMIVSMPGIELSTTLACVPVAQTALAFKAILQGGASNVDLALVAVTEIAYAGIALAVAVRLASDESRALGGGKKKKKKKKPRGLAALLGKRSS